MFHNNFWPNLEMDLATGRFVERENLLSSRDSLYHMTNPQWMVDHLKDDLALQLYAFRLGYIRDIDRERISRLAARLDYRMDWSLESALPLQTSELLDRYSLRSTQYVLSKARDFATQNRKKLLVVLFDPFRVMPEIRMNGRRYDQEIVDYLIREKFDFFDMNEVQLREFQNYLLSFEDYMKLYFIGHYNPRGNHFFAYSIKDKVVEWLDPKPITYQNLEPETIDFKGYLVDYR